MITHPAHVSARIACWFLCVATVASPAAALPTDSWPSALRQATQRVTDVEWRLQAAAGTMCPSTASAMGIVLDSLDSYASADRPMIAERLGLTDLVQVAAVAAGSPAAQAGIVAGDAIVSVEGVDMSAPSKQGESAAGTTLALRTGAALAALAPEVPVRMILQRHGVATTVEITPVLRCASRIFVDTQNKLRAYSDGSNIVITARMVDFTTSQDELAILAGHELGHVIARHGKAANLKEQRRMEDHADVIGADLAACAGYDPKIGAPFWDRLEKTQPLRFLSIAMQSSGKVRARNVHDRAPPRTCPIDAVPTLAE